MKLSAFALIVFLISAIGYSSGNPNAILGPSNTTDPSLLLASNPLLKNQLYWWCHNMVNNPTKKPQPISLEGIVKGHWSNRFKPDGSSNIAHVKDHFATSTELETGSCASPQDPPPPGPCTGDCDHISGAETFEFEIFMGGTDVNLYVCEVGFGASLCNNSTCAGGDYMIVTKADGTKVTITGAMDTRTFQKGDLEGSSAQVFLNSINAGSSYFVRYCLNVERLIVGNPTYNANDILTLEAATHAHVPYALTPYLSTVGLQASVFHRCGSNTEVMMGSPSPVGFANLTEAGDFHINTTDFLNLNTTTETCSWKILFSEVNNCVRPVIAGGGSTFLHTELIFDLSCKEP